jgi:hypothetical protein
VKSSRQICDSARTSMLDKKLGFTVKEDANLQLVGVGHLEPGSSFFPGKSWAVRVGRGCHTLDRGVLSSHVDWIIIIDSFLTNRAASC